MVRRMEWTLDSFVISTRNDLLQLDAIQRFLSREAYWSLEIPKSILQKAIDGSLCFGVYDSRDNKQVGFARVVTDKATFAWLCDVYIEAPYRGRGLSQWLVKCIKAHPDLQ